MKKYIISVSILIILLVIVSTIILSRNDNEYEKYISILNTVVTIIVSLTSLIISIAVYKKIDIDKEVLFESYIKMARLHDILSESRVTVYKYDKGDREQPSVFASSLKGMQFLKYWSDGRPMILTENYYDLVFRCKENFPFALLPDKIQEFYRKIYCSGSSIEIEKDYLHKYLIIDIQNKFRASSHKLNNDIVFFQVFNNEASVEEFIKNWQSFITELEAWLKKRRPKEIND